MTTSEIIGVLKEARKYSINYVDTQIAQINEFIQMTKTKEIMQQHEAQYKITKTSDGRWRTFLPDGNGKRGKEIKKQTREALEEAVVDYYLALNDDSKHTFKSCYEEWREYHFKLNGSDGNTRYKYQTDYERFLNGTKFEKMPISKITDVDIDAFLMQAIESYIGRNDEPKLTYKSFARLYEYLEGTFKRAYRMRIIDENPMERLSKKDYRNMCRTPARKSAATELIPDDAYGKLLARLYQDMNDNPLYFPSYAVELGALTGMRVAELAVLKWSDIDFVQNAISISRSDHYDRMNKAWEVRESTKTGKDRLFPMDDTIVHSVERIKRVQKENGINSEWLFPHQEYGWTHSNIISSCIKNKCKQLGLERTYGIHAFRKTLNSDMRSNGASALLCSGMMGNSIEVNNTHYTYDSSNMNEKREHVTKAHSKHRFA